MGAQYEFLYGDKNENKKVNLKGHAGLDLAV